jgi:BON domain
VTSQQQKGRSEVTSASSRLSRLRNGFLSIAILSAGASAGIAQTPASPFGYTARLQSAGFANTGFQNSGFRNTGLRSTGFQNVGFRNSSLSNTGLGSYVGPGYGYANVPSNFIGNGVPAPSSPIVNNTSYYAAPQQTGIGVSPAPQGTIGTSYPAADDTASIIIGPGTNLTSGFSMPSISRGARYTLGLGFDSPVGTTNPRLSQELQSQFANSSRFSAGKNINVAVENNVVVLRGKVADAHERDLAEMFVRLSPGVYDVRNELQAGDDVATTNR